MCIAGAYYGFGKHGELTIPLDHLGPADNLSRFRPPNFYTLRSGPPGRRLRFFLILRTDKIEQTSLIAVYLWTGAALLIKLSFLLFYHRLDERKPMRWAVYVLMTLVVVQNLGMVFVTAFACMPGNALWPKTESVDGRCWSYSSIQWYINANGIAIAVLDSAILLTPLFMLHRLAIPKVGCYSVKCRLQPANQRRIRSTWSVASSRWQSCPSLVSTIGVHPPWHYSDMQQREACVASIRGTSYPRRNHFITWQIRPSVHKRRSILVSI